MLKAQFNKTVKQGKAIQALHANRKVAIGIGILLGTILNVCLFGLPLKEELSSPSLLKGLSAEKSIDAPSFSPHSHFDSGLGCHQTEDNREQGLQAISCFQGGV